MQTLREALSHVAGPFADDTGEGTRPSTRRLAAETAPKVHALIEKPAAERRPAQGRLERIQAVAGEADELVAGQDRLGQSEGGHRVETRTNGDGQAEHPNPRPGRGRRVLDEGTELHAIRTSRIANRDAVGLDGVDHRTGIIGHVNRPNEVERPIRTKGNGENRKALDGPGDVLEQQASGTEEARGAENREGKTTRPHKALDQRLARIVRQIRIETGIGDRRPHQTRDARGDRRINESRRKADGLQMGGPGATMATRGAIMAHPVARCQDVDAVKSLLKKPRITGVRKGLNATAKRIRIGNRAPGEGNDAATRGQKTGRHEAAGVRPGTGDRDSERGRQTEEPPRKITPTRVGRR